LYSRSQGTKARNYLVYVRAPRGGLKGKRRSVPLVLETRRGRSTGLSLRILNILRPSGKAKMISPTMVIGIRVRIVG